MTLNKASKDETSRFVDCTRLKQNFKLLGKPVSLCNKAIHACRLQSVSSFLSWQRWLVLALQCVYCNQPLQLYLNHVCACANSYTNISHGVHSRAAFVSLGTLEGAAFIRGRRSFKGGVQSNKYGT